MIAGSDLGPRPRRHLRHLTRGCICVLLVALGLIMVPGSAGAHTDLDFTLPTDEASVGEPVSEITVGFTEPVTLVGDGFEVLDPQGNIVVPFAVTDDDQVFRLQLDPPLGGGTVGVGYEVRSQDGHVVAGTFSFTVSVPAPTTTTVAPTTAAPEPTEPTAAPTTTDTSATNTTVPATTDNSATDTTVTATTAAGGVDTAPTTAAATTTTGDVADDDDDDSGSSSTWIILGIAGVIVIGAAAFLLFRPKPPT